MRNEHYKTKQKDLILDAIKKYKGAFTIKDIYNKLKDKTGLTTIYRLVGRLDYDGYLNKSIGKDNITYYQYIEKCSEKNHFYLKCEVCKNLEHVDCDCISDLTNHILNKHNFNLNKNQIIISGICKKCIKGE